MTRFQSFSLSWSRFERFLGCFQFPRLSLPIFRDLHLAPHFPSEQQLLATLLEPKFSLENEITEARIKGSIHHEISHWLNDSLHGNHIKNRMSSHAGGADLKEADKRPHMLGKGAEKVPRILLLLCIALH